MNNFRRCNPGRTFGVWVLLAAWLAVSNHCAIALLKSEDALARAEVHQCCSANQSSGEDEPSPDSTRGICCKSLRLLPLETSANLVKCPDLIALYAIEWLAFIENLRTESGAVETKSRASPLRAWSFAETVLQQSLPGNAPPRA